MKLVATTFDYTGLDYRMTHEQIYERHRAFAATLREVKERTEDFSLLEQITLPPPPIYFKVDTEQYFHLYSELQLRVPEYDDLELVIKYPITSKYFADAFAKLRRCVYIRNQKNGEVEQIFAYGIYKIRSYIYMLLHKLQLAAFSGNYPKTFRQVYLEMLCDCNITTCLNICYEYERQEFNELFAVEYYRIAKYFVDGIIRRDLEFPQGKRQDSIYLGYFLLEAPNRYQKQFLFFDKYQKRCSRFQYQLIESYNMRRNYFFESLNAEYEKAQICSVYYHQRYFDFNYQIRRTDVLHLLRRGGIAMLIQKIYMENFHSLPNLYHIYTAELKLLRLLLSFMNYLVFETDMLESLFDDTQFVYHIIQSIFQDVFNECVCEAILRMQRSLPGLVLLAFLVEALQQTCRFRNKGSANFLNSLKTFVQNQLTSFMREQLENLAETFPYQSAFDEAARTAKLTFDTLPSYNLLYLSGIFACLVEAAQDGLYVVFPLLDMCIDIILKRIALAQNPYRRFNELNLVLNTAAFVRFPAGIPTPKVQTALAYLAEALRESAFSVKTQLGIGALDTELREAYRGVLASKGVIGAVEIEEILSIMTQNSANVTRSATESSTR